MKNKKGFTLIELLAIIVILAIIAVITVPIILNVIDNAKKGAAINSAYGYKDAVNKWYVTQLTENKDLKLNDTYTVTDGILNGTNINNKEIAVLGDKPSNGYLTYSNNALIEGCLTIADYKVIFENGNVKTTEKGECEEFITYTIRIVSGTKGNLQSGDVIKIGNTEEFYVVSSDNSEDGKTVLLAKYILNSSDVQDSESNFEIPFSTSFYWVDDNKEYISPYSERQNTNYVSYVYDSNSLVYEHVENYVNYLKKLTIGDITGRLLDMQEKNSISSDILSYIKLYDEVSNHGYWLGNAGFVKMFDLEVVNYVCGYNGRSDYVHMSQLNSIRPVIEVNTSDIQ